MPRVRRRAPSALRNSHISTSCWLLVIEDPGEADGRKQFDCCKNGAWGCFSHTLKRCGLVWCTKQKQSPEYCACARFKAFQILLSQFHYLITHEHVAKCLNNSAFNLETRRFLSRFLQTRVGQGWRTKYSHSNIIIAGLAPAPQAGAWRMTHWGGAANFPHKFSPLSSTGFRETARLDPLTSPERI